MSEVPLFLLILAAVFALLGGATVRGFRPLRPFRPSFSSSWGGAFRGEKVPRLRSGRRRALGVKAATRSAGAGPCDARSESRAPGKEGLSGICGTPLGKGVFRGGPGVVGFVDSRPEMPM